MTTEKSLETTLIESFDQKVGLLGNGTNDPWLVDRRRAIKQFAEAGFPAAKSEAYKYTPVSKWLGDGTSLELNRPETSPASPLQTFDGWHIHTLDGRPTQADLEGLPDGVTVCSLREAYETHTALVQEYLSKAVSGNADPFASLATAFADDGVFIHVAEGVHLDKPLYIHHSGLSTNGFIQPRVLLVAARNAHAHVVEHFGPAGAGTSFENRVVEMFVGADANVRHLVIFEREPQARFVNTLHVHQAESSVFATNHITLGGDLVRHNLHFLPDAEHCETHLNGLYIARNGAHIDNHTMVDHAKPNCFSNELFKGIIADGSTGVFNGKVLVRQDAQKINAYQSSKSILLDRSARIFAKPELEIYADDVKCSHGATTGELDKEALFYLQSRGIPAKRARTMLIEAFARDVIELVTIEPLRDYLNTRITEQLSL